MVNKTVKLGLWAAVLSVSAVSFAGGPTLEPAANNLHSGWVLGFDGGAANYDWPGQETVGGNNGGDDSDTVLSVHTTQNAFTGDGGVFVGYELPVSAHFALEPTAGYRYIGNFKQTESAVLQTAGSVSNYYSSNFTDNVVDFLLSGLYQMTNEVNFFLQSGLAVSIDSWSDYSYENNGDSSGSGTNVSLKPEVALGVGVAVTQSTDFFVKYDYLVGNSLSSISNTVSPSIGMVNAGFAFKF